MKEGNLNQSIDSACFLLQLRRTDTRDTLPTLFPLRHLSNIHLLENKNQTTFSLYKKKKLSSQRRTKGIFVFFQYTENIDVRLRGGGGGQEGRSPVALRECALTDWVTARGREVQ